MKKRTILLSVALTAAAMTGMVQAQEDGGATASVGLDVNSAYIFRGATVNDDVNVNPTIEASVAGVTVGTWGNFNTDASQFDEVDYYIGYDLPLGDDSPVGVSVGYTEYTYPTQNGSTTTTAEDGTTSTSSTGALEADREIGVTLSASDLPLSPTLGVFVGLEGPFLDESLYIELGGSHSLALTEENNLDLGVTVGYEAGDNVSDTGLSHVLLSAGTDIGPASIALNYVVETDDDVLAVDEEFFVSIGIGL